MSDEPVRIGVIGCGGYAFHLIQRVLAVPQSGLVAAVTSRDTNSSGAQFCRERDIPVFATVEELLAFGQFDVIINPTPIHLHAPLTQQCFAAGYPVWLEKPPVATVQELDELQAAAEAFGHPVAVCFNSLYSSIVQQLKEDLVAGKYGKVKRVKGIGAWIRTSSYFNRNSWAGKLRTGDQWILDGDVNNPFAHVLCNNLYLASPERHRLAEPVSVQAELYRSNAIESEDTSCLRIITREGVEILDWLTLSPKSEIAPKTVIETDKALITFENFSKLRIELCDGSVITEAAEVEDRIEMVQHLCDAFRSGQPYVASLPMMRPFCVTVNSAFESTGRIHSIPAEFLHCEDYDGASRVYIDGITESMECAFQKNALFSEIALPWAVPGDCFPTEGYQRFPVRFAAG